jgi:hypothetical protein
MKRLLAAEGLAAIAVVIGIGLRDARWFWR